MAIAEKKTTSPGYVSKAKRNKAQKMLKSWADDGSEIELITVDSGLRVRGTVRQLDHEGFLFVSASREISSLLQLLICAEIVAEPNNFMGPTLRLKFKLGSAILLQEMRTVVPAPEEMAAIVKQLQAWSKLKVALAVYFQLPLVATYSECEIQEISANMFSLVNEKSRQVYFLDLSMSGSVDIKRENGHTTVNVGARTGHFFVAIADTRTTAEEAMQHFAMSSKMIH